jgi:hypothetical protein
MGDTSCPQEWTSLTFPDRHGLRFHATPPVSESPAETDLFARRRFYAPGRRSGIQQKRMIGDLQDIGGRSASCVNDSLLHRHLLSACWDRYIGTTRKIQRRCCLSGRADMLRPTYGQQRLLQRGESHRRTLPARVPRVRLHRYPFR